MPDKNFLGFDSARSDLKPADEGIWDPEKLQREPVSMI
jgi:hypothetical protein